MYIVRFNNGKKHSAWLTKSEANKQLEVLENSSWGIRNCYIEYLDCNYSNGQYFV